MKNIYINVVCIFSILFSLILSIVLLISYCKWKNRTKYVKSSLTNEHFLVQNNKNEPDFIAIEAANRLSRLTHKIDILVQNMLDTNYPSKEVAERLYSRWKILRNNPNGIRETSPDDTSAGFTINKSEQMRICIRKRNSKNSNDMFEDETPTRSGARTTSMPVIPMASNWRAAKPGKWPGFRQPTPSTAPAMPMPHPTRCALISTPFARATEAMAVR